MKHKHLLIILLSLFYCIGAAHVRVSHRLYPFSRYEGDTLKYLDDNLGSASYYNDPVSAYLQDMDPAIPFRTFIPYTHIDYEYTRDEILCLYCSIYTVEEMKRLIQEGKPIYGIQLYFFEAISKTNHNSELFDYLLSASGLNRLQPWTLEIEQKIGRLPFFAAIFEDITKDVKRALVAQP